MSAAILWELVQSNGPNVETVTDRTASKKGSNNRAVGLLEIGSLSFPKAAFGEVKEPRAASRVSRVSAKRGETEAVHDLSIALRKRVTARNKHMPTIFHQSERYSVVRPGDIFLKWLRIAGTVQSCTELRRKVKLRGAFVAAVALMRRLPLRFYHIHSANMTPE
jgi:hypothetical protein